MSNHFVKFNINSDVRVQLTDYGRHILTEQFYKLNRKYPNVFRKFELPHEDADGWSTWQMWHLMEVFGEYVSLSGDVPFNTEIEIPIK